MTAPMSPRPRVLIFDAGNTLIRIAYDAIAEALLARGYQRAAADVEEAEIRARVRLDPHLAPGRSTESRDIHGRYLRYVLEHLGVDDEADIAALARWRDEYNRPVGLWHR